MENEDTYITIPIEKYNDLLCAKAKFEIIQSACNAELSSYDFMRFTQLIAIDSDVTISMEETVSELES